MMKAYYVFNSVMFDYIFKNVLKGYLQHMASLPHSTSNTCYVDLHSVLAS